MDAQEFTDQLTKHRLAKAYARLLAETNKIRESSSTEGVKTQPEKRGSKKPGPVAQGEQLSLF